MRERERDRDRETERQRETEVEGGDRDGDRDRERLRENISTSLIRDPQGKAREPEAEVVSKEKTKGFPEPTKNARL